MNLKDKGAQYAYASVAEDGNIITGSGPYTATKFVKKIIDKLGE